MTSCNQDIVPFPRVVRVEPSSQCNLACRHCPTGIANMARGLMKDETFCKVLEAIRNNREFVKVVTLYHGGEPLLNRDFYDMVIRIKKLNSSVFVKTVSNGMALTASASGKLIKCGIDAVEISLDGESPEESQFVRRKSDTKRIVANIKCLAEMIRSSGSDKPNIYISTAQFVREIPPHGLVPDAVTPEWLLSEFKGVVKGFIPFYAIQWPHLGVVGDYNVYDASLSEERRSRCDNIMSTITIRADGSVVPCCFDLTNQLVMGNIHERPLEEIWNGKEYRALRRSIRNRKYRSICKNCFIVGPVKYLIPKWLRGSVTTSH